MQKIVRTQRHFTQIDIRPELTVQTESPHAAQPVTVGIVELFFKQNLGFLKEQSGRYQLAYASVHLSALRYLLLFEAMLRGGHLSFGEVRDRQSGRLQTLTYAALLWQLFRALIEGALEGLVRELGRKLIKRILNALDQSVEGFLNAALQISPQQVLVQLKAQELG